jgi:uncharacterized damage-inducible protein DinB
MADLREMIVTLANQECLTGSWNGPALIETLRSISPEEAASTDTYEGYSAWSVALHVLQFKHVVATGLGAEVPAYVYEKVDFPSPPENQSRAAWDTVINELEAVHKGLMDAVNTASEARLNELHEKWKVPVWESMMWSISHDTNHNGQIRNMGLASLRKPSD